MSTNRIACAPSRVTLMRRTLSAWPRMETILPAVNVPLVFCRRSRKVTNKHDRLPLPSEGRRRPRYQTLSLFMCAGSENNSLYLYYKGLSKTLLTFKFDTVKSVLDKEKKEDDINEFVSAVCWRALPDGVSSCHLPPSRALTFSCEGYAHGLAPKTQSPPGRSTVPFCLFF